MVCSNTQSNMRARKKVFPHWMMILGSRTLSVLENHYHIDLSAVWPGCHFRETTWKKMVFPAPNFVYVSLHLLLTSIQLSWQHYKMQRSTEKSQIATYNVHRNVSRIETYIQLLLGMFFLKVNGQKTRRF
jgi:hypothetical protein